MYFPALYLCCISVLYKVFPTFESVDEILKRGHLVIILKAIDQLRFHACYSFTGLL